MAMRYVRPAVVLYQRGWWPSKNTKRINLPVTKPLNLVRHELLGVFEPLMF